MKIFTLIFYSILLLDILSFSLKGLVNEAKRDLTLLEKEVKRNINLSKEIKSLTLRAFQLNCLKVCHHLSKAKLLSEQCIHKCLLNKKQNDKRNIRKIPINFQASSTHTKSITQLCSLDNSLTVATKSTELANTLIKCNEYYLKAVTNDPKNLSKYHKEWNAIQYKIAKGIEGFSKDELIKKSTSSNQLVSWKNLRH